MNERGGSKDDSSFLSKKRNTDSGSSCQTSLGLRSFRLDPFTVDWNDEIGFAPRYLYERGMAA